MADPVIDPWAGAAPGPDEPSLEIAAPLMQASAGERGPPVTLH